MPIIFFVIILISSLTAGNLYQNFIHKPQEQSNVTQTIPSTAPEGAVEAQQEVNQDEGVTSNNVKGVSNTNKKSKTKQSVQSNKDVKK